LFEDLGYKDIDPADVHSNEDKTELILYHFDADLSASKIRPPKLHKDEKTQEIFLLR